ARSQVRTKPRRFLRGPNSDTLRNRTPYRSRGSPLSHRNGRGGTAGENNVGLIPNGQSRISLSGTPLSIHALLEDSVGRMTRSCFRFCVTQMRGIRVASNMV